MLLPFFHSETVFKASKQIEQSHAHPDACCPLFSLSLSPQWASTASLCPQIRSRNPNEIIFGLNDGYYAADFDHKVQPLSIFQRFRIIMEYPVLISLALFGRRLAFALKHWHVAVAGSVGAEEKQSASGRSEFSQELLQRFLFAQVRFIPHSSITSSYHIIRSQLSPNLLHHYTSATWLHFLYNLFWHVQLISTWMFYRRLDLVFFK